MASQEKNWWVEGGLKITRQGELNIIPQDYDNPESIKNLHPYWMDNSTAIYLKDDDVPFTKEDIISKAFDLWDFKLFIHGILEDQPDGIYYIHARPPPEAGRLHGLYCVPIAKLDKRGSQYDWENKYSYKTKEHPYKRKKKKRYKKKPEVIKPRHQSKIYLIHDPKIFEPI